MEILSFKPDYQVITGIVMVNKIQCAHILVEKQNQALKIMDRIRKGEKFGKLARELSLCPSAKREGNLGYFGRGQMVNEFETTAFKLQVAEISDPVKTKFGYHIIKRLS